jgi:hypothetical protein
MKGKRDEPAVHLTLGSKYRVRSLASREAVLETSGVFKGVVSLGSIDAIAMEIDAGEFKGKLRVIPTHMVVAIDILEAVSKEVEAVEDADMHYT